MLASKYELLRSYWFGGVYFSDQHSGAMDRRATGGTKSTVQSLCRTWTDSVMPLYLPVSWSHSFVHTTWSGLHTSPGVYFGGALKAEVNWGEVWGIVGRELQEEGDSLCWTSPGGTGMYCEWPGMPPVLSGTTISNNPSHDRRCFHQGPGG